MFLKLKYKELDYITLDKIFMINSFASLEIWS